MGKKAKRIIIGVLSSITLVYTGIRTVLSFLGDIDLIVERVHNPGWIGDIFNHFVSFSPKANMAILVISSMVLGYLFYSRQKTSDKMVAATVTATAAAAKVPIKSSLPPLLVDYDPARVSTYFQVLELPLPSQYISHSFRTYTIQICRVSLENTGSTDIANVQVTLIDIQPRPDGFAAFHAPMRFMHDREPFKTSITLVTGPKKYVDIVSLVLGKASWLGGPFNIEHTVSGISRNIPEREYILTIQVTGSNTPKITKRLRIWTDHDGSEGSRRVFMEMPPD